MPVISYRALGRDGKPEAGAVDAPDRAAVAAGLRARGLHVLELVEVRSARVETSPGADAESAPSASEFFGASGRDIEVVLRRLALMLRAGLSVLQAIEIAASQAKSRALKRCLGRVAAAVRSGASLSTALAAEARVVPPIVAQMVAAAEASGELDVVLERVALDLERAREIRAGLLTSLLYPAIVVLMAIGVTTYLIFMVIPKFARFLEQRGSALPASAQLLISLPDRLRVWGPPALVVVLALACVVILWRRTARGGQALDGAMLRVPVLGPLVTAAALARGLRTLALLLRSGVPLLDGLGIVSAATRNRALSARFARAADEVLRGSTLSAALRGRPLPDLVAQVSHVGERTGEIDGVLEELGCYYERELALGAKRLAMLFEPAVVVVVGGVVGFVYYTFFQVAMSVAR